MAEDDFEKTLPIDTIPDGGYVEAAAGGCPILVARFGEEAFAVEDLCSHADSPLHGGRLRGGRISCPVHGAIFDFRSGRTIGSSLAPCGLRTFATRVADGWVEIAPTPIEGLT